MAFWKIKFGKKKINSFPSSTKVHDLASNGRESHSKEKPDKLSFINATRRRHNHKTRYELNVSKNDLFTDTLTYTHL